MKFQTLIMAVSIEGLVAFRYKTGVIIGGDTTMVRGYRIGHYSKYKVINDSLLAFSGELGDIQYFINILDEYLEDVRKPLKTHELHRLIQRILYQRRTDLELLRIEVVVAGKEFLGAVNSRGNFWVGNQIATGSMAANSLNLPLLSVYKKERPDVNGVIYDFTKEMSRDEAIGYMNEILKVNFYNFCNRTPRIHIGIVDHKIDFVDTTLDTNWDISIEPDEVVLN